MTDNLSPPVTTGDWRFTAMALAPRTVTLNPGALANDLRTAIQASGVTLRSLPAVDVIRAAAGEQTISLQFEGNVRSEIPQNLLGQTMLTTLRRVSPDVQAYRSTATLSTLSPVIGLLNWLTPATIQNRVYDRVLPRRVVIRVERATGAPLSPPLSTSVAGNLGMGATGQRVSTDPQRSGEVTAREAASGAAAAAAGVGELGFPVWGYGVIIGASVLVIGVAIIAIRRV